MSTFVSIQRQEIGRAWQIQHAPFWPQVEEMGTATAVGGAKARHDDLHVCCLGKIACPVAFQVGAWRHPDRYRDGVGAKIVKVSMWVLGATQMPLHTRTQATGSPSAADV
jgi:hypothetical protein